MNIQLSTNKIENEKNIVFFFILIERLIDRKNAFSKIPANAQP